MVLCKIISGGQTGADQAGLFAAKLLGLETGGWMPKGWRTEEGAKPEYQILFGMKEHDSPFYSPRTRANVRDSEATLIFGNRRSTGSWLTLQSCDLFGRPTLIIPWFHDCLLWDKENQIDRLQEWIKKNCPKVLNVSGNRESTNSGIFEACRDFLVEGLEDV